VASCSLRLPCCSTGFSGGVGGRGSGPPWSPSPSSWAVSEVRAVRELARSGDAFYACEGENNPIAGCCLAAESIGSSYGYEKSRALLREAATRAPDVDPSSKSAKLSGRISGASLGDRGCLPAAGLSRALSCCDSASELMSTPPDLRSRSSCSLKYERLGDDDDAMD